MKPPWTSPHSARRDRCASRSLAWLAPIAVVHRSARRVGSDRPHQANPRLPTRRRPACIAKTHRRPSGPRSRAAWLVTLKTMLVALAAAVVIGVALAALFASSRIVEASLFPYAVILQVTPLVAVAPFIVLWIGYERVWLAQVVCAWIVAFFPILSNTAIGLRSADPGLRDLFDLYGATRWQKLRWLLAPSALPYFLAGLRISANLALVGAIVAEFVIGTAGGQSGLGVDNPGEPATSDTPMMFAALALVSLTGVGDLLRHALAQPRAARRLARQRTRRALNASRAVHGRGDANDPRNAAIRLGDVHSSRPFSRPHRLRRARAARRRQGDARPQLDSPARARRLLPGPRRRHVRAPTASTSRSSPAAR